MRRLIIVLSLISLSVLPVSAQQSVNVSQQASALWEQLHAQPADASIACVPLGEPGRRAVYQAEEPFPLASVAKLLIFIAYAQRVVDGGIDLNEMVALDDLNTYDLPGTNRGAHDTFLQLYSPSTRAIGLWDLAALGMMQYSSNAASDYVLARLGPVNWYALYQSLGVTGTGRPHAMSAIALLMSNHDTGQPSRSGVASLSIADGEALFARYLQDPAWRQAEIAYRSSRQRSFPGWDIQGAVLQHATITGTTGDFLNVLRAVYAPDGPLSDPVKAMTRAALRWDGNGLVDSLYVEYGSKLGYYSGGTLALVAYGHPLGGQPVISAAFFRNIPRSVYNRLLREDSIGYFAHWMNLNQCAGLLDLVYAAP